MIVRICLEFGLISVPIVMGSIPQWVDVIMRYPIRACPSESMFLFLMFHDLYDANDYVATMCESGSFVEPKISNLKEFQPALLGFFC